MVIVPAIFPQPCLSIGLPQEFDQRATMQSQRVAQIMVSIHRQQSSPR